MALIKFSYKDKCSILEIMFYLEFYLGKFLKEFKMVKIFTQEIKFTNDDYKGHMERIRKIVSRNVTNVKSCLVEEVSNDLYNWKNQSLFVALEYSNHR